ncbi:group II intron maturase-specific domain-containing protein, partial [Clostridium tyrobutyricum]
MKPSKDSIKTMIQKCSNVILKEGKAITQSEITRRLNLIIRGWTNYHRHVVASHTFSYINNTIVNVKFKMLKSSNMKMHKY